MKNRKWTGKQKLAIVLEGFKNTLSVSELCTKHEIGQSQYYKWRDQFLANGASIFDNHSDKKSERLEREIIKLKTVIGGLTVELKKTEDELRWLES
jgi:transposase-like protein